MAPMKYCADCGGVNRDEARFCGHCGRPFTIDALKPVGPTSNSALSMRTAALYAVVVIIGLFLVFFFSLQGPKETARRKLEQMGIPYTQDQFFSEARSGNTEAVELFLAAGMDPNLEGYAGITPLAEAVGHGHTDSVKALLVHGADANKKYFTGDTLLILAVRRGHAAIVQALLDHGAYVNTRGFFDTTALKEAETRHHTDIMQLLKQAGARE